MLALNVARLCADELDSNTVLIIPTSSQPNLNCQYVHFGVTEYPPRVGGWPFAVLKPADTRMISGLNSRAIGSTMLRNAARYSASPKLDTVERELGESGEGEWRGWEVGEREESKQCDTHTTPQTHTNPHTTNSRMLLSVFQELLKF